MVFVRYGKVAEYLNNIQCVVIACGCCKLFDLVSDLGSGRWVMGDGRRAKGSRIGRIARVDLRAARGGGRRAHARVVLIFFGRIIVRNTYVGIVSARAA